MRGIAAGLIRWLADLLDPQPQASVGDRPEPWPTADLHPNRAQDYYDAMLYWSDRAHVFVPPTMAGIGHPADQRCCLLCGGERTEYQHQPPEGFCASWERQGWRPEDLANPEPSESWADWLRRTAH